LAYLLTVGFAAVLNWPTQYIENALVVCTDGTAWDAKGSGITFFSTSLYLEREELCGLCTKRSADGKSYSHCDYSEVSMKESAYRLEKIRYARKPSIEESVVTALIVAVTALVLLEVIRMTVSYILFGKAGKPFWWRAGKSTVSATKQSDDT
jgi:hypothetical protein